MGLIIYYRNLREMLFGVDFGLRQVDLNGDGGVGLVEMFANGHHFKRAERADVGS
jgi:hypothetical protein